MTFIKDEQAMWDEVFSVEEKRVSEEKLMWDEVYVLAQGTQTGEKDDLEALAQKILDELLAEENGPVSEEEKQEVFEAIKAYLDGYTELELDGYSVSLEDDGAIELGVGGFLKKVWGKIKKVANKVVKAVTGRSVSDWRTGRKPEAKYKNKAKYPGTPGSGWEEDKHPRDASGRFAKKSDGTKGSLLSPSDAGASAPPAEPPIKPIKPFSAEDITEKDGNFFVDTEDVEGFFNSKNLPGSNPDMGVTGEFVLNGQPYQLIGNIPAETMVSIHEMANNVADSADELYPGFERAPVRLFEIDDYENLAKNLGADPSDVEEEFKANPASQMVAWMKDDIVWLDTKRAGNQELFEPVLYHESLHYQDREDGSNGTWLPMVPEETFTTLLTMEYAEKNGLTPVNGYPPFVSWFAKAATEIGWSKQKMYDFSRAAHRAGGEEAQIQAMKSVLSEAGMGDLPVQGIAVYEKMSTVYDDYLEKYWGDWKEPWHEIEKLYGLEPNEITSSFEGD